MTIQKKFTPSQFYQTSLKDKMTYICYCNTIESIEKAIDNGHNYIYYTAKKDEVYDYDEDLQTQWRIKTDIAEQLKSILSTYPNLMIFFPASDKVPQNLEFLLEVLPFPKQLAIECSNLWWYKEAKRCGILYPILSLNNLPKNHFKQIFHKNISLLSCSDRMFSNPEYLNIIKELHYRGATIFLRGGQEKNRPNYGVLFDALFI